MKRRIALLTAALVLLLCTVVYSAGVDVSEKTALRVLIIPKFEIGEMTGDFPGEAQLFYERYCAGCSEAEIPHMPPTAHFYVNPENGLGDPADGLRQNGDRPFDDGGSSF